MENQNDQVFEADQDVNAFEHLLSHSSHKGQDTLRAAFGGFESQQDEEDDRTPLLVRDTDQNYGAGEGTPGARADGRAAPTWERERDFEGRPWWNMPSVRSNASKTHQMLTLGCL